MIIVFNFIKKTGRGVVAPVNGSLKPLSEVPDQVFSQGLMGPGFMIAPTDGTIYSPVTGEVTSIFPTKHALTFKTALGTELLLHLGLDTVELNGEPFVIDVSVGDKVVIGERIGTMDLEAIQKAGKATDVITILTVNPTNFAGYSKASVEIKHGEIIIK